MTNATQVAYYPGPYTSSMIKINGGGRREVGLKLIHWNDGSLDLCISTGAAEIMAGITPAQAQQLSAAISAATRAALAYTPKES